METKKSQLSLTRERKDADKKVLNNASRPVTDTPQNFASSRFYLNFEIKVQSITTDTLISKTVN